MAFFREAFDAGRRFERNYGEFILRRFRTAVLPGGAKIDLEKDYVPVRGLNAALAQTAPVVLTGGAGAGKTTTLIHLALRQAHSLAAGEQDAPVPIFFSAAAAAGTSDQAPNVAHVLDYLDLNAPLAAQAPREFFSIAVASGRALVLIDDLDALPPGAVDSVINEFANARVVAASRSPVDPLKEFPLPGFRDEDIEAFARKWSEQNAGGFVAALKANKVPRALTANPLALMLLTRVCRVTQPNGETCPELPTRRLPLFDEYAQTVLKGDAESGALLAKAGLAAQSGKPASIELVERGHGFLQARKNGTAEFVHALWQAYFAARALRTAPDQTIISTALGDPRWLDVLMFLASMVDPSEWVEALAARGQTAHAGLMLAQASGTRPGLREQVPQDLLRGMWNGEAAAIAAVAELDGDAAVDALGARLKDADPAVRKRAAQLLGTLGLDRGVDYLLRRMRDPDPGVRDQILTALGKCRSERVLEPLLVALRGDHRTPGVTDTPLRVAAARALGEVGSDKAMPALVVELSSGEPEVRAAAAEALKRIASPLMIRPLASIARTGDEDARRYAADVLAVVKAGSG